MLDLLFAFAAWYLCGVAGFLYWWSEDFAVDARALLDALVMGLMGPITILGGYLIHRIMPLGEMEDEDGPKPIPVRIRTDDRRRPPRR